MSVVLPEPLGPTSATTIPAGILKLARVTMRPPRQFRYPVTRFSAMTSTGSAHTSHLDAYALGILMCNQQRVRADKGAGHTRAHHTRLPACGGSRHQLEPRRRVR